MQKWDWVFREISYYPTRAKLLCVAMGFLQGCSWGREDLGLGAFPAWGVWGRGFPCQGLVTKGTDNPQKMFAQHFRDSTDRVLESASQGKSLGCVEKVHI